MSLSPVTPAQIKATLPDPNSSLCGNFVAALIRLPQLFYTWFSWAFGATGAGSKSLINQTLPTGSLTFSACTLPEDGTRLLCDGRTSISQTTYADLFAAIGSTYGAASGGNFTIPDYRARFPVGIGNFATAGSVSLGVAGGEDVHQLTVSELPSHAHSLHALKVQHGSVDTTVFTPLTGDPSQQSDGVTANNGSNASHNNVPPFLGAFVYIVC